MAASLAGAQGVLDQLGGSGGGRMGEGPKPEVVCKRFETALELRSVADWSALDVIPDAPPVRPDLVEAAMQRLGGTRLVLAVDAEALRKQMLEQAREDIRGTVRQERLGSPGAVMIRGDTVEFRPRGGIDVMAVAKAFAPLTSDPSPPLVSRAVDGERAANGVVAFAVSDHALEERRISSRQIAIERLGRRVYAHGFLSLLAQPLGRDRILVVVPGLTKPDQLLELLQMTAKLTFRIAERFADPCIPAKNIPVDAEVLRTPRGSNGSVLVQKRVIAGGENVARVAVVRDTRTGLEAVALRLDRLGGSRLAKATQDNVERGLAVVLDNEIIAMPTIREPIAHETVLFSGPQEARELSVLLRAGWLAPRLTVVEQQVFESKSR